MNMNNLMAQDLIWVWAILGGIGVFLAVYGIAKPKLSGGGPTSERDQIREAGLMANLAYRVAVDHGDETGKLERQLKAANWFWAPGELEPPDPAAPFYTVRGYRAACIYQALFYGVAGFLAGTIMTYLAETPFLLVLPVAGLLALVGYTGPGAQLQAAVKQRQHRMTVEMAFRLPELAAVVSTGRSLTQALRVLMERPGGPFITEIARLLRTYDVTTSFETAVASVINHNHFAPLTEFLQQLELVESRGGSLAPALRVQAEAAQKRLKRHLIEQGQANAQQMQLPVVSGSSVIVLGLVAGPALWMMVNYL
jgi:Flp pilus assembly protein TadB